MEKTSDKNQQKQIKNSTKIMNNKAKNPAKKYSIDKEDKTKPMGEQVSKKKKTNKLESDTSTKKLKANIPEKTKEKSTEKGPTTENNTESIEKETSTEDKTESKTKEVQHVSEINDNVNNTSEDPIIIRNEELIESCNESETEVETKIVKKKKKNVQDLLTENFFFFYSIDYNVFFKGILIIIKIRNKSIQIGVFEL
jgi:hypothetical protein